MIVEYFFDGGGPRQEGGPAGWGWVAYVDKREQAQGCGSLDTGTNNEAEYTGLIMAATHAISADRWSESNDIEFVFSGDSKLVIMQTLGVWKVKAAHLVQYRDEARRLLEPLNHQLVHVFREQNGRADMLATQGRDNHGRRRMKPITRR